MKVFAWWFFLVIGLLGASLLLRSLPDDYKGITLALMMLGGNFFGLWRIDRAHK